MYTAVIAALFGGASIGLYALWHLGYDIPVLSGIGRLIAQILFPGESDIRDLAKQLSMDPRDLTDRQPCNICSGIPSTYTPTPSDTWTGAGGVPCREKDRPGVMWYILNPIAALGWEETCGKYEPAVVVANTTSHLVVNDCMAVRGLFGLGEAGMPPKRYILKRLFNTDKITDNMQYNEALFYDGSPYQSQRAPIHRASSTIDYSVDIMYKMNYSTWLASNNGLRTTFIPPMLNETKWEEYNRPENPGANITHYYWAPSQFAVGPRKDGDTFEPYILIDKIKSLTQMFTEHIVDTSLYFSLEWCPNGVPRSFEFWTDDQYRVYIAMFMQCASYSSVSTTVG